MRFARNSSRFLSFNETKLKGGVAVYCSLASIKKKKLFKLIIEAMCYTPVMLLRTNMEESNSRHKQN